MSCPDSAAPKRPDTPAGDPGRAANALFHDLTRWREQLSRSIARNNLALRSGGIAAATNRILFSLLFLRIAEERGLVAEGTLLGIADHPDRYGQLLEVTAPLFPLFEEAGDATRHDAVPMGTLVIEDRVVSTILLRLLAPDRPYGFATMEIETVAEVLARYLARTIRRSAVHQADVVDTHDTVLSCGTRAIPLPVIRYLAGSALRAAEEGRSKHELLPVRVIDPACGTGTVLLSAFRYLLASHGGDRLTFEERHAILTGSLHGVDPGRYAVAATKMLLLFLLCEGDRPASPGAFPGFSAGIFRELRHTIRCGDALTGPDIVDDESWAFCTARERHTIHPFAWPAEFPEIFTAGGFDAVICNPPGGSIGSREWIQRYLQRHYAVYDPSADRSAFFIGKGFTLLRPGGTLGICTTDRWLRGRAGTPLRSLLTARRIDEVTVIAGTGGDMAGPGFCILQATNLPPGRRSRVTLVDAGYAGSLADYVKRHAFPVGREALGDGGWSLRDNRAGAIVEKARLAGTPLEEYVMGESHPETGCPPAPGFAIDARARKALVSADPRCNSFLRPVIDGAAIGRYEPVTSASFMVFVPRGWTMGHPAAVAGPWRWFKKRHPALARFLKEKIGRPGQAGGGANTGSVHTGDCWWETSCDDDRFREKTPRIFFRERFGQLAFFYDGGRAIPGSGTVALPVSGPYLAGVLNSRLIAFVFAMTAGISGCERVEYSWDDLRSLPVYTPDFDDPADAGRHDRIVSLVNRSLDLRKKVSRAETDEQRGALRQKIEAADRKIDRIVYELYGLDEEEIAVVEENPA
ncbi:Eco57I restriction-modification methylase domain-containing protein [Methanoregula sp.]|uniref:Eco57I restriction-modification methylase domain-containing protein n=1 Tax=Methanoregula sp. TaxID=2052170 RepID=UPI003C74F881